LVKISLRRWLMPHRVDLYGRWSQEMRRKGFFRAGERVGAAVSGGPDSVLLLHFMKGLASELGFRLAAVHFNHHLRGAESDADEQFVRKLAGDLEIEFLIGQAEVAKAARERRRNLEATARDLRYRFFFSLVSQGRLDKVATAHTANDQAETVLLRLLRGTGSRGLAGIYPILEGKVMRPFLDLTRPQVMLEIANRKLQYRLDTSNLDAGLRRNRIRQQVLPWLEKEFNPEIIALLKQLADRSRDDEAFLEQQAHEHAHPWRARVGCEEKIAVRPLEEFPAAIARRVLRQMLQAARGSLLGVTHTHIDALLHFATEAQSGRTLTLPGGLAARKEFDWLVLAPQPTPLSEGGFSYSVTVPGELTVAQLGLTFRFKIVAQEALPKAYNGTKLASLDCQTLRGELRMRNWRAGDFFRPAGSRKARKLKDLFREQRIPRLQRTLWPVLESDDQIVWVRGFPPGDGVAPLGESSKILLVEELPANARR
jgi:tRNA(Ile)-lysidine synthase